jgi:hypothetical protein
VANDELIVLEMKISFERNAEIPYVYKLQIEKRQRAVKGSRIPPHFKDMSESDRMKKSLDDFFVNKKSRMGLTGL